VETWFNWLLLGTLLAVLLALLWLGARVNQLHKKQQATLLTDDVERDVEHIFDDKFRQELRNRGTLHFEKIISENAMFLQQDLRLTSSELTDFMKKEVNRTLQAEFAKYEQSIADAKQIALDSIAKTQEAIEQQRKLLSEELAGQVEQEKQRIVTRFEKNMADIVNHYVLEAIGNEIDLDDQLEYILQELNENKQAIVEDVKRGA
jgi:hypothetical protein